MAEFDSQLEKKIILCSLSDSIWDHNSLQSSDCQQLTLEQMDWMLEVDC